MPQDPYPNFAASPGGPARSAFAIVPGAPLPWVTSVLYVGTAGDVTLRPVGSEVDVVYRNVPAGSYLTVRASAIRSSGTTAADIIGEL